LKKEELNSVAEKVNVGMDPSASSLFDDNADNLNVCHEGKIFYKIFFKEFTKNALEPTSIGR